MMKRTIYLFLFTLIVAFSACAQNNIPISTEKVVIDGEKYYLHTVASGQTLYSICKAYSVTEETLIEANPGLTSDLKLDQVIHIPVEKEISDDGSQIVYTVKKGDTLYSLCKKYGITEDEFYELNPQVKPRKGIKIGKDIYFPNNSEPEIILNPDKDTINFHYHIVQQGETFYSLTKKYVIAKEDLLSANPDLNENAIKIGQEIRIPKDKSEQLTEQHIMLDSLAQVNFGVDSTMLDSLNPCDTATWFTHGKDFEIALLLPFDVGENMRNLYNQEVGNKDQRLYLLTEKIVSFYSGFLVALEELKTADVNIELNVYDVGKGTNAIEDLIKNHQLDSLDLIIGPAFRSQLEYFNDNFNDTSVTVVVPFVNDDVILEKYSNNIAIKTCNSFVYEHIADFAAQHPQNKYFVIKGSKKEQEEAANNYYNALKYGSDSSLNVTKIVFNGSSLVSLKSQLSKEKENVFILPFEDEASAMKIFTDLFPHKDIEITLISSSTLLNYESIDPNYFRKVKFTYFSSQNIDYSDSTTNLFISKYRDAFLCEPDEFSFIAYDAVKLVIPNLIKYGKAFSKCMDCDDKIVGITGDVSLVHNKEYAARSFSNSTIYLYQLQDDFTFKKIYPEDFIILDLE